MLDILKALIVCSIFAGLSLSERPAPAALETLMLRQQHRVTLEMLKFPTHTLPQSPGFYPDEMWENTK